MNIVTLFRESKTSTQFVFSDNSGKRKSIKNPQGYAATDLRRGDKSLYDSVFSDLSPKAAVK